MPKHGKQCNCGCADGGQCSCGNGANEKQGFKYLWKNRAKLADKRLPNDLKSFLPPSLEVVEKVPHPVPRVLLAVITLICIIGLIWAIVGKVDIITSAEGKIIPTGKVKEIQPFALGVVTRIYVTEGQMVTEGEPLIELDQTQTSADEFRLTAESKYAEEKRIRYEVLAGLLRENVPETEGSLRILEHPVLKDDPKNTAQLLEEYKSITKQLQILEHQREERLNEMISSGQMVQQYESTLPLVTERAQLYKRVYEDGLVTVTQYISMEEERLRQHHSLEAERARYKQLEAALKSVEKQLEAQRAQSLSDVLSELDELERQCEIIRQELAKAQDLGAKQVLYAPVSGTVKGLVANTVGGVVQPAQILMEIVPLDEVLEVEAFISNQDIGYVMAGQTAEVKIHTFPFTKYGIIDAVVENVADDATVDENLGLIYRTRLVLDKNTIRVDGKDVQLIPGMSVTAEIATDQRRLIEFFLAPLLRMKAESLRER